MADGYTEADVWLIGEELGACRNGRASDGRGWFRSEAQRVECNDWARTVLDALVEAGRLLPEGASPATLDLGEALKQTRAAFDQLARQHLAMRDALADCVVKATEYGTQDGGFVATYILPTGPLHRAIPLLAGENIHVRPGFDGRTGQEPVRLVAVPDGNGGRTLIEEHDPPQSLDAAPDLRRAERKPKRGSAGTQEVKS